MDFIIQNKKKVKNEMEIGVLEKRIYAREYKLLIKNRNNRVVKLQESQNIN